jgi:peptidylprolyl isomerase
MKKLIITLCIGCIALGINAQKKPISKPSTKTPIKNQSKTTGSSTSIKPTSSNNMSTKQPGIYATFETDKGNIVVELEFKKTPMTVANFVGLAEGTMENTAKPLGTPFYDGLKFHRVISKGNGDAQDFMLQGGDPQGTGSGGPGYQFPDEIVEGLNHSQPGVLSMANAGPGTNGSQFFITVAATTWLDGKHTVFGKVLSGMDVANTIKTNDGIKKVVIERVGPEAKAFKADKSVMMNFMAEAELKKNAGMMKDKADFAAYVKTNFPKAITLSSGLAYVMEKEGTGPKATKGQKVSVHYRGTFPDGNKFDASYDRNEPIEFPLGQGMVIPGWEEGIALLNKGAKAKLIIPYWLAYGVDGRQPQIPAKATLLFETELMDIK